MTSLHRDRAVLAKPVQGTLFEGTAGSVHGQANPLVYADGPQYRDVHELLRIVEQLVGKPVTLLHPDGLVSEGALARIIGKVVASRLEDSHAVVSLMLVDDDSISREQRGISLGYTCSTDGDGFQRNITVDHVAIVPVPRCETCELRIDECVITRVQDCACKSLAKSLDVQQHALDMPLDEVLMDELSKKLADALADVAAQKARADQAEKTLEDSKLKIFNLENDAKTHKADVDAAIARADKADADATALITKYHADASEKRAAEVSAKVVLVAEAAPILGKTAVEVAKMTDRAIQAAVVMHVDGDDLEKMTPAPSDHFVAGAYNGAVKRHARAANSRVDVAAALSQVREVVATIATTTPGDAEAKALQAMRDRMYTNKKDKE